MDRNAEVRRVLGRYLVEIVEAYDLCPWARPARLGDEVAIEILWGKPDVDDFVFQAEHALMRGAKVAMIVAPELPVTPSELRDLRNGVAARIPSAGVAEFHPDAIHDATTPPRLVPYLRRSPDPMLQLVPLELLDGVRGTAAVVDRELQAKILAGTASPPRGDVADDLAIANHARVTANADAVAQTFASIMEDRRTSYARVGVRPRQ